MHLSTLYQILESIGLRIGLPQTRAAKETSYRGLYSGGLCGEFTQGR